MRTLLLTFSLVVVAMFATPFTSLAQDSTATEAVQSDTDKEEVAPSSNEAPSAEAKIDFIQVVKQKFIEGGVIFMGLVLICLILGLAIAIERIIVLNLSTTNVKKLLKRTRNALASGGVAKAQDLAARTKGPVASIFSQGLLRHSEGIDNVEKSIIAYGQVEMGKLEKGLSWISLFIAIAPLLGFMGTVLGMIDAFQSIMVAEGIEISEVAGGIQKALLTTVAGLIVAIILQVFYNYCISKIDSIVNQMEDASISFVDTLIAHEVID